MPGIVDSKNGYVSIREALTYNNDFYLRNVGNDANLVGAFQCCLHEKG